MIGAGVPTLFYLSQTLSNMGDKLEVLKYSTLFTLFNPTDIIKGEGVGLAILTFIFVAILSFGVGAYIFSKRDLSI